MNEIEQAVINSDNTICENIDSIEKVGKLLAYQNILNALRTFVEAIAVHIYAVDKKTNPAYSYDSIQSSLKHISSESKYVDVKNFHKFLQQSKSHFSSDDDTAERFMIRYFEFLIKLKIIYYKKFNVVILHNIAKLSPEADPGLSDHYTKILSILEAMPFYPINPSSNRYYVQKRKPVYINGTLFYEITLTQANDYATKFDRRIAFTKCDILPYYSIVASIHEVKIDLFGKEVPVEVISDWAVSIRPCEFTNLISLFGFNGKIVGHSVEYKKINQYLTNNMVSLTELVALPRDQYLIVKSGIIEGAKSTPIFEKLDRVNQIILEKAHGANVLRYLLFKMNNQIIKEQFVKQEETSYGNCGLSSKVFPFDSMPFCSSLRNHNPRLCDVLSCIEQDGHEEEFLAHVIQTNTVSNGKLYTPIESFENVDDVEKLKNRFNQRLSKTTESRKICQYGKFLYIKGSEDDTLEILNKLSEKAKKVLAGNRNSAESWLSQTPCPVDDEEKKTTLKNLFDKTSVAIVYGAAGTGKSTLINHVASVYFEQKKLLLTNTHPALENLQRKVQIANTEFSTIASFLANRNADTNYDILVIDECSTVNNRDMKRILSKCHFKLLLLTGDTYQIESITFGNWFFMSSSVLPKCSINELKNPHRTSDDNLLKLWGKVRNLDSTVYEFLCRHNFVHSLDNTIFSPFSEDEIILCLNYDGLYGVNCINSFLQAIREGNEYKIDIWSFKIGDPILFNETDRFYPVLYNNLKGKIVNISEDDEKMYFSIRIPKVVNEIETSKVGLELIESSSDSSVISFWVKKKRDSDEDDASSRETLVPFQVAYAVSIHKAQGLEFDSVKIVITNEIEEMITHNIFYTAITRAKQKLTIYWTPETQKYVIDHLHRMYDKQDEAVLKSRYAEYLATKSLIS